MGDVMVRISGLTKQYGSTLALSDLDLTVERGEVLGYLGPNGAGKTTTLRLLMGLLRPTRGRAAVAGHDCWTDSVGARRRTGYVSGEPALYDRLTGREHVDYLGHLRGQGSSPRASELAARLDLDLDRRARELSKGNRQKLALVLALMAEPEVLLLDEPTGGLDPFAQQEFHRLLRDHAASGGAVLLSSHILSEVQRTADRVGVLREGRLVAVDRLEVLRARSLHHVTAVLREPVPPDLLAGVDGLRDVSVVGDTVRCSAPASALDDVVKALARYTVDDLECAEAELEETFLAYYGKAEDDAR